MSFPLRSLTLSKRPELDRSNHHPRERPRATARHCRKVYCHRKRVGRTQLSALLDRYGLVLSLLQRKRKSRLYRSEEHTSELQSLMRISYAVFCLKKKKQYYNNNNQEHE